VWATIPNCSTVYLRLAEVRLLAELKHFDPNEPVDPGKPRENPIFKISTQIPPSSDDFTLSSQPIDSRLDGPAKRGWNETMGRP